MNQRRSRNHRGVMVGGLQSCLKICVTAIQLFVVQYLGRVCLLNRSRYPGPGRDASRFTGALDLLTVEAKKDHI